MTTLTEDNERVLRGMGYRTYAGPTADGVFAKPFGNTLVMYSHKTQELFQYFRSYTTGEVSCWNRTKLRELTTALLVHAEMYYCRAACGGRGDGFPFLSLEDAADLGFPENCPEGHGGAPYTEKPHE